MATGQTVYDAPQTVEPEEIPETPGEVPLAVEGYEPPPTDGNEEIPPTGRGLPIRAIILGILGLGIIVGIIVFIVRFLGGGTTTPEGTLTYWGLWEEEALMKTVIDDYQRENPKVTIAYKMQSPIEYRERLQAAIARGEGPDIFRYHNTWMPMMISDLAPVPQDVMSSKEMEETYYPVVAQDIVSNNKFYGIPIMIDGLMMYYNKDILAESGFEVPTTWEQFEEVTRAITIKDGFSQIEKAGAALGTAENVEHFSDILGVLLIQSGADFNNLVSEPAEKTLSFYTLFAQSPNNIWDAEQDNSVVAFAGGKVGFIFAPSWQVFTIQALNPNLNFGTAEIPQVPGATKVGWASYWVEGVSAKSTRQQAAFEFLKYLSSKEVVSKLFTEASKTRPFGEPYARVDLADQLRENEYLRPIADQAPSFRSWYMSSRTHDNGINDKIISYFKDAVNAIYQGSSPQGALETTSRGVADVLIEYNLAPK